MWFQRTVWIQRRSTRVVLTALLAYITNVRRIPEDLTKWTALLTVVDRKTNARLSVVFDNFFARLFGSSRQGNYWILHLDPDYRVALVSTPDRRYLWVLSLAHLDLTSRHTSFWSTRL